MRVPANRNRSSDQTMNAPIHYSDDTMIDALTTCMSISQAAKALGVSRGWLFPHAKRLEREGRILPKSIMPAYFKPKEEE